MEGKGTEDEGEGEEDGKGDGERANRRGSSGAARQA